MVMFNIIRRGCATQNLTNFIKGLRGFDSNIKMVKILKVENGNLLAEMKVGEEHTNPMGTLHGGLSTTLVDSLTSFALITHEKSEDIFSVSVDMHMTYLKGASVGEEIVIDAKTLRVGKTLAFCECDITNKATGELLVKGKHTKFLLKPLNK